MKSFCRLARRRILSGLSGPQTPVPFAALRLWQRNFSASPAIASKLAELDPSQLDITKTTSPKKKLPPQELAFGKTFTGKAPLLPPWPLSYLGFLTH